MTEQPGSEARREEITHNIKVKSVVVGSMPASEWDDGTMGRWDDVRMQMGFSSRRYGRSMMQRVGLWSDKRQASA